MLEELLSTLFLWILLKLYTLCSLFSRRDNKNDTIPLFPFLHCLLSNSTSTSTCVSTNTWAVKEKAWGKVQQLLNASTWKQWVTFCYWIKSCCLQNQYSQVVDRKVAWLKILIKIRTLAIWAKGRLSIPRFFLALRILKGRREVISVNHWDGGGVVVRVTILHCMQAGDFLWFSYRCYLVHTVLSHSLFSPELRMYKRGRGSGHLFITYVSFLLRFFFDLLKEPTR